MPDFQRLEKGVGLHSAVFQKPVLQANGLYLVSLAKPAPTAKDRLHCHARISAAIPGVVPLVNRISVSSCRRCGIRHRAVYREPDDTGMAGGFGRRRLEPNSKQTY